MSSLDELHFLIHSLILVKCNRKLAPLTQERSHWITNWFRLAFKKWFLKCGIPLYFFIIVFWAFAFSPMYSFLQQFFCSNWHVLMTSSSSCYFCSFWLCLDMHCVDVGNCIENAQSAIGRTG